MIVRVTAYAKTCDPLVDPAVNYQKDCEFKILPRIGEWVECIDDNQFDEHDVYVVKAIRHVAREFPRRKNVHAPSLDSINPYLELILEIR